MNHLLVCYSSWHSRGDIYLNYCESEVERRVHALIILDVMDAFGTWPGEHCPECLAHWEKRKAEEIVDTLKSLS